MTTESSRKVRVLLIDDESGFTRTVKLALDSTGDYEVEELNEAEQAAEVARRFRPDIIFCDIVMPGMDGGDVAAAIRELPGHASTPFVFLTAIVAEHEAAKGTIGGFPFLPKPVSLEKLVGCIDKELGR